MSDEKIQADVADEGVVNLDTPDEGLSEGQTPVKGPEEVWPPTAGTQEMRTPDEKGVQEPHTLDEGADAIRTPDEQPDVFPREYVEKLRRESAGYRERARQVDEVEKRADELARRLHAALVAADGRLADPSDLPFDPAHLDGADSLKSAIADLVAAKPHLKARRVAGDIGAGYRGDSPAPRVDLLQIMKGMQ